MQSSKELLLAGVGRCDITPAPGTPQGGWGAQEHERGVGADMPLLVTVLALAQGNKRCLIIDADAIGFDQEMTGRIVDAVHDLTQVPRDSIRFSCTHTHSGANTFRLKNISVGLDSIMSYLESLPLRIAGAAWQALQKLEPVKFGVGTGNCFISRNRRVATPEGETVVGVKEDLRVDSSLGVLRFDREDGTTLATILHYACHPTIVGWQNQSFTPDYPGPARAIVEEHLGGHCLFLQGAAGDLGPRRGFTGDLSVYRQLGHELGLTAAGIASGISTKQEKAHYLSVMPSGANIAQYAYEEIEQHPSWKMLSRTLHLPVKKLPSEETLAREFESLQARVRELRDAGDLEQMRLTQAKATQMGWKLENARRYAARSTTEWPMQVLRIGQVALVSLAGEPFSSIAIRIRAQSPAAFTFVSGYSNGGFGYIPDRDAYSEGGYEVEATPFSADAGDIIVREALNAIHELFQENVSQ